MEGFFAWAVTGGTGVNELKYVQKVNKVRELDSFLRELY